MVLRKPITSQLEELNIGRSKLKSMVKNKKCPCCEKETLNPEYDGFEICSICGWQDDG